jgi:hypothetical protein
VLLKFISQQCGLKDFKELLEYSPVQEKFPIFIENTMLEVKTKTQGRHLLYMCMTVVVVVVVVVVAAVAAAAVVVETVVMIALLIVQDVLGAVNILRIVIRLTTD